MGRDLPPFAAICADPEVMRWIGDGSPRSQEQCRLAIRAYEAHWNEHGFGLYATTLRETGELIGSIGLSIPFFLPEILPAVEIGWRVARDSWGKGLATEAARAVMEFAFAELELDEIVSIHQVGNDASERVMDKLGMRLVRETVHPKWDRPLHVHAIGRRDYFAA